MFHKVFEIVIGVVFFIMLIPIGEFCIRKYRATESARDIMKINEVYGAEKIGTLDSFTLFEITKTGTITGYVLIPNNRK